MKTFILFDVILLFFLVLPCGTFSGEPSPEGYSRLFFKTQTIGANATASIQITKPGSVFSIYLNQSASFTFQQGSGVGFKAASASLSSWYVFTGSRTLELVPQEISSGTYLWIRNGAAAQTFKFFSLGD